MSSAETLQKVFKTLSDPTRLRILRLLATEELAVQELMDVLGMAQSRVSRHLAILREAGLLSDRRDGTYVLYRMVEPLEGAWQDTWDLVERSLRNDPTAGRDRAALARVIDARVRGARSFFDAIGPEWDALRTVFDDDALRARAVTRLIPPGLRVADVGTGTGVLALELARLGAHVIGIDNAPRMLEAARQKLERSGLTDSGTGEIEWRVGDAAALPLADAEVDAAFAHMVLHSLAAPADAIVEMARVTQPGGVVVAVDFVPHEQEWMRRELGALWLGFAPETVGGWLAAAGLEDARIERFEPRARGRDLPGTFIASARKGD